MSNENEQRLSVRVPSTFKAQLRQTVQQLQQRGANTTQSELVQMLVAEGLLNTPDQLDAQLRQWRTNSTPGDPR